MFIKLQSNDSNISTQHIATLLGATCCAHLATLLRRVVTCRVLLAQISKWSNFSCNICGCCMMLQSFGQVRATMLRQGMRTCSIFNSQHVATRHKPGQLNARNMLHLTMLRCVASRCCDRLVRACKYWVNNVAICYVELLRSFGRGFSFIDADLTWVWCPGLPSCAAIVTDSYLGPGFARKNGMLYLATLEQFESDSEQNGTPLDGLKSQSSLIGQLGVDM